MVGGPEQPRERSEDDPSTQLNTAMTVANSFREAQARLSKVAEEMRGAVLPDTLTAIESGIEDHARTDWLGRLLLSLGNPSEVHFAIHSELQGDAGHITSEVSAAWGNILEVESRRTWDKGTLLTLRPRGGREAGIEDRRPATSSDIFVGNRVYQLHGDHKVLCELVVDEVGDPSADYKGFTANDGRRYGLDGTMFVLMAHVNQLKE